MLISLFTEIENRRKVVHSYYRFNKITNSYPYFPNNESRKRNKDVGKIFILFWACFRSKSHFSEGKKDILEKKTAFFLKKTKSFGSKNEVLAPLTLRFFGKRRRFPTVKTPSFFNRSSIYLQLVVRQLVAKPSNTRKISMRKLSTENSQATKLKELKIVNLERLRTKRNDKECEKSMGKSMVLTNARIEFSE